MIENFFKKENLPTVVSILLVIALGLYSAIAQGDPAKLAVILPLVSILIVFLLFLNVITDAEKRINLSLDRRLPPTEHLENRQEVERETVKLVEQASEFIIATGGRSRNKLYLKAIENKVSVGDVPYWRFIYDEEITHDVCEHICVVLGKSHVFIRQIKERDYGNLLVVDSGFIVVLPVPGHGGLMGINVPNSNSAQRMSRYVMMLNQDSQTISNVQQVKEMCEQCGRQKALAEQQPVRAGVSQRTRLPQSEAT